MATNSESGGKMSKVAVIQNRLGLHARPAAMFVREANRHRCEIHVEKDGETINGKSIMGLMMLAAGMGSRISIIAIVAAWKGATALATDYSLEALRFIRYNGYFNGRILSSYKTIINQGAFC